MSINRVTGVLVCGNICLDLPVWPVDRLEWGTTAWVDVVTRSIGGNGANTSYTLAKLGVQVRLHGTVGDDDAGRDLLGILRNAGVDTSTVDTSEQPTTTSIVLVDSQGNRLFLHRPGSSGDVDPERISRFEDLTGYSHFHLANPFTMPHLRKKAGFVLQSAKAAGLTTSLDLGWDALGLWMEEIGPCLPHTDLLFLNDKEARKLTGRESLTDAIHALQQGSDLDVILKTGKGGCTIFHGNTQQEVAGFAVEAVDTTGAGDCFAGAFLAALGRDWGYAQAAKFANAVGACNVQKLGAVAGVLTFDSTLAWMETRSTL